MPPAQEPDDAFPALPDPGQARTLDDLVERLRLLKVWAGDPSYENVKDRVNAAFTAAGRPPGEMVGKTTVVDCFRTGRRRLNTDLFTAVVAALHPDPGYVAQWRQALRVVISDNRAASQVRVQDSLPQELAGFTGRSAELDALRRSVFDDVRTGGAVCVLAGMAGVGKTQLAVQGGHILASEKPFDRVLFVNLRGFHPDQPAADPAAVLDGFLRLLGVPGQKVPRDLPARTAAYRERLAGTRTLVVLDDAADERQVRPLLPANPDCVTLVTSRRSLIGLTGAVHLMVDVFSPEEARQLLHRVAPDGQVDADPDAVIRIARRCGHLPLALGLVTGHILAKPGWTLTDHADRLDERHHHRRLDTGVELALDLSYQHLSTGEQRLLRLLALHPGQDADAYAAAALGGTDLPTAQSGLRHLSRNHVVLPAGPGRYALHDLVRAYAAGRASDEDPPPERRAALTRLFDYYVTTAAAAMDALFPAEASRRPRVPDSDTAAASDAPVLGDAETARGWLDTERSTLVAVAVHAATNGWPRHATRLSATLFRYLLGGHFTDALTVHDHACRAARHLDDPAALAQALTNLGVTHMGQGRFEAAADEFHQAQGMYQRVGDLAGQARAQGNLGVVEERLGRPSAVGHHERALDLFRQLGDRAGQARALLNLGLVEERVGQYGPAAERYERSRALFEEIGDRQGIASALRDLGTVEVRVGRLGPAAEHLQQALAIFRDLGNRDAEAWTLDSLGTLHRHLDRLDLAIEHYRRGLALHREIGDRHGEAWALNALGEGALATGRAADAIGHHTAAHTIAVDIGASDEEARAHAGLGTAHQASGDPVLAREHLRHALTLFTRLGMPAADEVRASLDAIDGDPPPP
jgi:tetratricopeptide (TPR) repeat protein